MISDRPAPNAVEQSFKSASLVPPTFPKFIYKIVTGQGIDPRFSCKHASIIGLECMSIILLVALILSGCAVAFKAKKMRKIQ